MTSTTKISHNHGGRGYRARLAAAIVATAVVALLGVDGQVQQARADNVIIIPPSPNDPPPPTTTPARPQSTTPAPAPQVTPVFIPPSLPQQFTVQQPPLHPAFLFPQRPAERQAPLPELDLEALARLDLPPVLKRTR